ncbi:MAG: hypothetical protein QG567_970, partial [Campylobacterota bacterium]|nr:hypothetical protein [Campylobacterota bacterium]
VKNITYKSVDRKSEQELQKELEIINPDFVLDMICFSKTDADIFVNASKNLKKLSHYVMVSTFYIYNYSDLKEEPFDDNIEIDTSYTKNKIEAENRILNSHLFNISTIVRLPFVFSYDDYSNRFQNLLRFAAKDNNEIKIDNTKSSLISRDSAASFLANLPYKKPLGVVDVSNDGCVSFRDILKITSKIFNTKIAFIDGENTIYPLKKDICLQSKKVEKLKDVLEVLKEEIILFKENYAD